MIINPFAPSDDSIILPERLTHIWNNNRASLMEIDAFTTTTTEKIQFDISEPLFQDLLNKCCAIGISGTGVKVPSDTIASLPIPSGNGSYSRSWNYVTSAMITPIMGTFGTTEFACMFGSIINASSKSGITVTSAFTDYYIPVSVKDGILTIGKDSVWKSNQHDARYQFIHKSNTYWEAVLFTPLFPEK